MSSLATINLQLINEVTAPRHAPTVLQPSSKPGHPQIGYFSVTFATNYPYILSTSIRFVKLKKAKFPVLYDNLLYITCLAGLHGSSERLDYANLRVFRFDKTSGQIKHPECVASRFLVLFNNATIVCNNAPAAVHSLLFLQNLRLIIDTGQTLSVGRALHRAP